ncbi:hypothetical protein [Haladaptatus halobius]|uniref:hypothetical protein n=1 Tax=Haladaptatus halobius TaxID=2884875 RepID=UPI001D0A05AC|nr:hypothetical protein [Haladaptatus halobius]
MSGHVPRQRLALLRAELRTAERERNRVGMVLAAVTEFHEAVSRGDAATPPPSLSTAFDRFGPADGEDNRQESLTYLTVPLARRDDGEEETAFDRIRSTALTIDVSSFVDALEAYVEDAADWAAVAAAFEAVLGAIQGGTRTDALSLIDDLVSVFEVATEAALSYRDDRIELVCDAKSEYLTARDDPVADLDGQPVALLPVRLETRFVGPKDDSDAAAEELRIRVYPDQVHVDSHEPELTDNEVHWGRTFWTRVWLGCHKQVDRWDAGEGAGDADWIQPDPNAVPAEFRPLVDDLDPADFQAGEDGYREIKTAAWRQLTERFGTERASWLVRATAPETFADELLEAPLPNSGLAELSTLSFEPVDRRPSTWTSQPRACLLPDRWVAWLTWEDGDGKAHATTVSGPPISEPLSVGPSPEAASMWRRDGETADAVEPQEVPPGMEWLVDYSEAAATGMALSVDLESLSGFDAGRGFTRVVVLGVRGSMDADTGANRLADLLRAHHYTDGLAVLPQGTPTNVFDQESGYSSRDVPEDSVDMAAGPPSISPMDGTDGDRLARALGFTVDEDDEHVFGRVANADGTEQLDARHMNSALWPATLGYFLQHLLVSNEWVGTESLWDGEAGSGALSADERRAKLERLLPWVDAYREHFVEYVRARGPLPAIRVGTQPYGILPTGALSPDTDELPEPGTDGQPNDDSEEAGLEDSTDSDSDDATGADKPAVDEQMPSDLAGWLRRFEPSWAAAAEDLPWATGDLNDETLVRILQREGLSYDVIRRQYLTGAPRSELEARRSQVRETLRSHNMRELDPRIANLDVTGLSPAVASAARTAREPIDDNGPPPVSTEPIEPADFVDNDVSSTINALISQPPDAVRELGLVLEPETRRAVLEAVASPGLDGEDSDVGRTDGADVADVVAGMLAESEADPQTTSQIQALIEAVDRMTEAGDGDLHEPNSLLEVLLYYGTLHAYLNARVRLGTRHDDPGILAPEPQLYLPSPIPDFSGDPPYYAALSDTVPDALTAHPAVDEDDSYGDALFAGAVGATPPISLEPRLSEFTDSLSYLGERPPAALATAMVESLDLASHRLDAWWTSLSTRRLAEVREHQGLWGPSVDSYEAWEVGGDRSVGDDGRENTGDGRQDADDGREGDGDGEQPGSRLDESVLKSPGINVGAYGFIEGLAADPSDEEGEFVHAPSLQHATTAALLRSGHLAHEGDSMGQVLSVDLSADRVREALGLVYGVRDGQSLGEQLGYRFERRLVDHTIDAERVGVNVQQYRTAFREAFRLDQSVAAEAIAATDVVDGYALVRDWENYPFRRSDLPARDTNEFASLQAIVAELSDALDAVGDLLTAESVHQLGKGNFERTAASLDALAAGTTPPDPAVVRTPREAVGVTHRTAVLFGDPTTASPPPGWPTGTPVPITDYPAVPVGSASASEDGADSAETVAGVDGEAADFHIRRDAEPALDAWLGEVLPAPADVEFLATYRWSSAENRTAIDADGPSNHEHVVERTVTLDELDPSPLDLLALGGSDADQAATAFEARAAYVLLRDRPAHDPPIPVDATLEIVTTETARDDAIPVADLLAVVHSFRALVLEGRAVDGTDLAHPEDGPAPGYTPASVDMLRVRADEAEATLATVRDTLENRLAVLDPPGDDESLLSQLEAVTAAAESFVERVPVEPLIATPTMLDGDLDAELGSLAERLKKWERARPTVDEAVIVRDEPSQEVSGQLRVPESPGIAPTDIGDAGGHRRVKALAEIEGFDSLLADSSVASEEEPSSDAEEQSETGAQSPIGPVATVPDRFRNAEVTVQVWSRTPADWFERTVLTTSDEQGVFAVEIDFSGVPSGTSFAVVATVDGEVTAAKHGRVVDESAWEDTPSDGRVSLTLYDLAASVPRLSRLLWLDRERRHLAVGEGTDSPAQAVDVAIANTRWQSASKERELFDPSWSTLSESELAATDALLELATVDLSVVDSAVTGVLDVLERLGVSKALTVDGDATASGSLQIRARRREIDAAVRNRIQHFRANPVAFHRNVADALLGFSPAAALAIDDTDDPTRLAGYLHVLLAQPAAVVFALDEHVDEPHRLLATLGEWLYGTDAATARTDDVALENEIARLEDAVETIEGFETLFAHFERERADDSDKAIPHRTSFARLLGQLRNVIAESPPAVPNPDTARAAAASAFADAVDDFQLALTDHFRPLQAVTAGTEADIDAGTAFRHGVLETVRVPLVRASYFGVYGSTPQSPVGGTPTDETTLRTQAGVVLERVDARLDAAADATPDEKVSIEQAVDAQDARLRALFGDEFVVLPPFVPANGTELARTFGNDGLLAAGSPLAAETWLQPIAQVNERQATFREALSYAEALSGRLIRDLSVGQLPHRPEDDWVGVDGVAPEPGQLSLVVQFGLGLSPPAVTGPICGLFVDEHVEHVPTDTETAGLAINYDEPDNRAPQSILLAVPPPDSEWTFDALASAVRETIRLYKYRGVDLEDLPDFGHLLPMLAVAYNTGVPPDTQSVDFESLGTADGTRLQGVAPSYRVFADYDLPNREIGDGR